MSSEINPTNVPQPIELRHALGAFATGVTVVTVLDDEGERHGMTATSFASLSLDPPLIQWSLRNSSWSHPIFTGARQFAVNVLGGDQEHVSRLFSSPIKDRFEQIEYESGLHGLPLLGGSLACFECSQEQLWPGGDHTIIVGRVLRARRSALAPLLHWNGKYAGIRNEDAGATNMHGAGQRVGA